MVPNASSIGIIFLIITIFVNLCKSATPSPKYSIMFNMSPIILNIFLHKSEFKIRPMHVIIDTIITGNVVISNLIIGLCK